MAGDRLLCLQENNAGKFQMFCEEANSTIGVTLQAGATGAVRAIKLSTKLTGHGDAGG